MSDSADLFEAYADASMEEVRDLCRQHTKDAVATLVRLMNAPRTPPGVKRACAKDILDQGWGRPDARGDGASLGSGIVINVIKLSGRVEKITHNSHEMETIAEAREIAKAIALGPGGKDE
jgi:hypothetical protein